MGVGPMMTFHAGNRQVIKGLPQKVVDELVKRAATFSLKEIQYFL